MTSRPVLIPGTDHPITLEPTGSRVTVRVGDRVVADTTNALTLREADYPPVQYIPLADVDDSVLAGTEHHTYCPYKGEASYYTIHADAGELANKVWTYPRPHEAVAEIAGHVAFYPDAVDIAVA